MFEISIKVNQKFVISKHKCPFIILNISENDTAFASTLNINIVVTGFSFQNFFNVLFATFWCLISHALTSISSKSKHWAVTKNILTAYLIAASIRPIVKFLLSCFNIIWDTSWINVYCEHMAIFWLVRMSEWLLYQGRNAIHGSVTTVIYNYA